LGKAQPVAGSEVGPQLTLLEEDRPGGSGDECINIGKVAFPAPLPSAPIQWFTVLCVYKCSASCPGTIRDIRFFWNFSVNEPLCPKKLPRSRFNP
jgi:hypothetical protein